ncbi:MAG: UDP-N-acetylmuramoyl-L-alanine--D-glutamate ligase [Rhodocyclaceae bacterium]|nr:MAG: UDP-N-acetylmuramoyl-L-alanine--D-glutamate ligase [Rhodocyclaceae bacterium]
MNLNGKLVLVLGLGESGLAMARWGARRGARVRVADTRAEPPALAGLREEVPEAEFIAGEFDKALLEGTDVLALSPGLSGGLMVVLEGRARGIPVVGEIELFAQGLRDLGVRDKTKVIAITGTNGKTTTTALTGHLCRCAGRDAEVAGNISPAALDALMRRLDSGQLPEIWVLEVSSFQLESMESLNADAASVLNISDDHLDRYIDIAEYASAKARIFGTDKTGTGVQVLNRNDPRITRMALPGRWLISFGLDAPGMLEDFGLRERRGEFWLVHGDTFLLPLSALPLTGLHNAANALAALALCTAIGLPLEKLVEGLRSFKGLPHRVEKIAEINGVTYYDDSKGTNVGATVAALEGLGGQLAAQSSHLPSSGGEAGRGSTFTPDTGYQPDRKIVLIAGGDGKGQDFSPLGNAVARHARGVVLIGRDAKGIQAVLESCGVLLLQAADMLEAVQKAAAAAMPGDAVLLSPACASFDMYRNYVHRAEAFAAAVKTLCPSGAPA